MQQFVCAKQLFHLSRSAQIFQCAPVSIFIIPIILQPSAGEVLIRMSVQPQPVSKQMRHHPIRMFVEINPISLDGTDLSFSTFCVLACPNDGLDRQRTMLWAWRGIQSQMQELSSTAVLFCYGNLPFPIPVAFYPLDRIKSQNKLYSTTLGNHVIMPSFSGL